MSFNLDSLFIEWREKVPTGVPNVKNDYHLVLLKEICLNKGIEPHIVDNVILVLEQSKKIDPETIVKYKGEDGEEKESQYSYASKQPEGTPAKVAADKLKDGGEDDKPSGSKLGPDDFKTDPDDGGSYLKKTDDVEDVEKEKKKKSKDGINAKLKAQTERYDELNLDKSGVPKKKPENVEWGKHKSKIINDLTEVDGVVQSSTVIPDDDKQNITNAIQKISNDNADEITDDESAAIKRWVAVKDQTGNPTKSARTSQFYVADINPNDWRYGQASVGGGEPARQARKKVPNKKAYGKSPDGSRYEELEKLRQAIGLKSASPMNSRTSSKMVAPTTTNTKRKPEPVEVVRKNGKVVSATMAGQTHTKKNVPKIGNVERELISQGVSPEDAKRQARSVVLGIQRYNDQIDLLADAEGGLEIVDYGDVSTTEGRKEAINQSLQNVANGLEKVLEASTPPHPPLTREHYELIEKIKGIKNPLDDSEWDNLQFEEQQDRIKKFEQDMGEILIDMNALGDIGASRAEVAESITFMHRLSQGYNAILPASETFKVSDVFAIKDPGDTSDPKVVAESIQQILVSVEASGGESVKFDKGARSSSAAKVSLTVYKNKGTRKSIKSLLDTYDKVYNNPDGFPPSDEVIEELDDVRDETKAQAVRDGIMTEEEYDKAYEVGLNKGEKAFNAFVKKSTNVKALKEAGFADDDLRKVRDVFMKHCAHGITMAEINNRDTQYNRFNNVSHKIQGFKKDKSTGEVINKGKYKTVEMDGINTISGMEFSCDQGFEITKPSKTKTKSIKPKNTNPSGIIGIKR